MQGIDLQILDRNGILLYEGSEGWDGKYQGQSLNPDTYFYSVRYLNIDQQVQIKKGYVTLVQ